MSPEYNQLLSRCEALRVKFIDFAIPNDRSPSSDELDSIAAFKLLMHAELEYFIEERARHSIRVSIERWKSDAVTTRALFVLSMKYYPGEFCQQCPTLSEKRNFDEVIRRCENKAMEAIRENNGIKRGAFRVLAAICGILSDDLDAVLVGALDRLGDERGQVAHTGIDRVRSLNSPEIEYERAKAIVDGLAKFDEDVESVVAFGA